MAYGPTMQPKSTRKRDTLDDLLLRHGVGVTAFCESAGIPPFSLRRLRQGRVDRPRIATLVRIAQALGVSPERVRAAVAESAERAAQVV